MRGRVVAQMLRMVETLVVLLLLGRLLLLLLLLDLWGHLQLCATGHLEWDMDGEEKGLGMWFTYVIYRLIGI